MKTSVNGNTKRVVTRFAASGTSVWVVLGLAIIAGTVATYLGRSTVSEVLLLSIAIITIVLMAARMFLERRVLLAPLIVAIWFLFYTVLILLPSPKELSIAWTLAGILAVVVLWARKAEF